MAKRRPASAKGGKRKVNTNLKLFQRAGSEFLGSKAGAKAAGARTAKEVGAKLGSLSKSGGG